MSLKIRFSKSGSFWLLVFFAIVFIPQNAGAQCAGNDSSISICDISNPANQNINLFSLIEGSPVAGGIWSDPLQSGGLDPATGILNVWNIHSSGIYTFTYDVSNMTGCADPVANITVVIGGYSGITSPNGSACSDDDNVNLFQFFIGDPPSPHLNGTWHDDNNTGALNGNFIDATASGLGTFSFTYTIPAMGSCPEVSSTAVITVHRAPIAGTAAKLILCDSDDLSVFANLNLFDQLSGEDTDGQWSESGTAELASPFDSFINVQHIYDTFGAGTYNFAYTVYPTNPVCSTKTEMVNIIIEKRLDFTGASFVINTDICEDEIATATYSAVLTQGTQNIPNGTYQLTYTVSGPASATNTITADFVNGMLTFPIPNSIFQEVGVYMVSIGFIKDIASLGACVNIIDVADDLHIFPLPKTDTALLTIDPVCKNADVIIGFLENNLSDGNYQITYHLTGANNLTAQTAILNVISGAATFTIPAALVPNAGTTTISVTNIVNIGTTCANMANITQNFVINEAPNTANISVIINNACQNLSNSVLLSGLGNLSTASITYSLSGANTVTDQIVILAVSSGNASFEIPAGLLLNAGLSVLTITTLTNVATTCSVPVQNNVSDSFTIHAIPDMPTVNDMDFCQADNATVANLLPHGNSYKWYASATDNVPLADTMILASGNYFVAAINPSTGCASSKAMVTITINAIPAPVLDQDGQIFCGLDNPTLQDLTANSHAAGTIIWYDALTDGNLLPDTQALGQGITYYGFDFSDVFNCQSEEALAVTVTLTDCDPAQYEFFIPDGFSPNGDSVNDTFRIPDIEFLYPGFTLEIYNRYGNLLFKGNKSRPYWDGKNTQSGSITDGIVPNGVYFYIVDFNKGNKPPQQGRLYLNR